MALTNEIIRQKLTEKFGEQITEWEEPYGLLTFSSDKNLNLKVLQFLYDDPALQFRFLTDLCAVHYPEKEGQEIGIVPVSKLDGKRNIRFLWGQLYWASKPETDFKYR